jgi:hypothetical protein
LNTITTGDPVAAFAAVYVALLTGHSVGDHWIQTSAQAAAKGARNRTGAAACARHVLSLTLTKAATLAVTAATLHPRLHPAGVVLGFAIDAATHYFADRRYTLARLAQLTGKDRFFTLGAPRPGHDDNPSLGTGAYALDQSWHHLFLWLAALLIVAL